MRQGKTISRGRNNKRRMRTASRHRKNAKTLKKMLGGAVAEGGEGKQSEPQAETTRRSSPPGEGTPEEPDTRRDPLVKTESRSSRNSIETSEEEWVRGSSRSSDSSSSSGDFSENEILLDKLKRELGDQVISHETKVIDIEGIEQKLGSLELMQLKQMVKEEKIDVTGSEDENEEKAIIIGHIIEGRKSELVEDQFKPYENTDTDKQAALRNYMKYELAKLKVGSEEYKRHEESRVIEKYYETYTRVLESEIKKAAGRAVQEAEDRIRKKIDAFLSGVPIGLPGGSKGSTSVRKYDSNPYVRFAVDNSGDLANLASNEVEGDEIYELLVNWQLEQGTAKLLAEDGMSTTTTATWRIQHEDTDPDAEATEKTTKAEHEQQAPDIELYKRLNMDLKEKTDHLIAVQGPTMKDSIVSYIQSAVDAATEE